MWSTEERTKKVQILKKARWKTKLFFSFIKICCKHIRSLNDFHCSMCIDLCVLAYTLCCLNWISLEYLREVFCVQYFIIIKVNLKEKSCFSCFKCVEGWFWLQSVITGWRCYHYSTPVLQISGSPENCLYFHTHLRKWEPLT